MTKIIGLLLVSLAVTSCATQRVAELSADDDIYKLSAYGGWSMTSGGKLKGQLYNRAGEFCEAKGKSVIPLNDAYRDKKGIRRAYAELKFHCVTDDNQELMRPPSAFR